MVWRPGANRHPPPRPVSPAPHLRPPCLCACSLCLLPAAIKRSKEKDELCTTPGCVMAGKPRPPPPAALPRGGAPEMEGGARDGGRGEGRDAGRGSQDEALPSRGPGRWPRGFGAGGRAEARPRPRSGWRKQVRAPVLPAPAPQASPACSGPCPHWTQGLSSAFTLERRSRECAPSATFSPRAFS